MISDDFMKEAALELDGMMLDNLPDRGELDFSPAFERKMKKLIYRRKHPVMSHPAFRVAAAILVFVLLSGAVILAIPDAQASLNSLFAEEKKGVYSYYLTGYVDADDLRTYHLGWIPEGYALIGERYVDSKGAANYRNQDDRTITLNYNIQREGCDVKISRKFIKGLEYQYKEATVNGLRADLFELRHSDDDIRYAVIWMNEEHSILFEIFGARSEAEALKLAENVIAREPEE